MRDQEIIQANQKLLNMIITIARDLAKQQVAYNSLLSYLKTVKVKSGFIGKSEKLIDEKQLELEFKKEWQKMEEQAKTAMESKSKILKV